jgi:hypothetical protein
LNIFAEGNNFKIMDSKIIWFYVDFYGIQMQPREEQRVSFDRITGSTGWLTRRAYGYRDEKHLHLKIYDLPNLSTRKML